MKKFSQKRAASKVRELLETMGTAKAEERVAVPWFELTAIAEKLATAEESEDNGIRLGFILYMFKNKRDESIFLPKSVLAFLNE